jgi:exodeoxyribonuclease V gamma subunit
MCEDDLHWPGTALPPDDVDSADVDLVGCLAGLVDRLAQTLAVVDGERPLAEWLDTIASGVDRLTAVADSDAWQVAAGTRGARRRGVTAAGTPRTCGVAGRCALAAGRAAT